MEIENLNRRIIAGIKGYSDGYFYPSRGDVVIMREQAMDRFSRMGFSEENPPDLHTYRNIMVFITEKFHKEYS